MPDNSQQVPNYEGVDDLDEFSDRALLIDYRSSLLDKTKQQIQFIHRQFGDIACVAESCCGNGRLLIALANRCEQVWGYDIANSRVHFAQAWLTDLGIKNAAIFADNLFTFELGELPRANLAVCITGAFGYFGALSPTDTETAARKIAELVKPGGNLLLELYQHAEEVRRCVESGHNRIKIWRDLPPEDRFRFYLSDLSYDPATRILKHEKTFIGRSGEIDEGRRESLRIFEPAEIAELFTGLFTDFQFFESWDGDDWQGNGKQMIVTAKRKG